VVHSLAMTDERWESLVADAEGGEVSRGSMFGSQGLRTGKKFFAIWWNDQLVVKLPPARLTELVDAGRATPFEPMEGRRMNGWVLVGEPATEWPGIVQEAQTYVAGQNA
jgi:TfoX/Sxy family transcriptional regulator of competence genes